MRGAQKRRNGRRRATGTHSRRFVMGLGSGLGLRVEGLGLRGQSALPALARGGS